MSKVKETRIKITCDQCDCEMNTPSEDRFELQDGKKTKDFCTTDCLYDYMVEQVKEGESKTFASLTYVKGTDEDCYD